jgi:hypothetical protein
MNLSKQSRPVIRDVSRDPTRAQVEPGANGGGGFAYGMCKFLPPILRLIPHSEGWPSRRNRPAARRPHRQPTGALTESNPGAIR